LKIKKKICYEETKKSSKFGENILGFMNTRFMKLSNYVHPSAFSREFLVCFYHLMLVKFKKFIVKRQGARKMNTMLLQNFFFTSCGWAALQTVGATTVEEICCLYCTMFKSNYCQFQNSISVSGLSTSSYIFTYIEKTIIGHVGSSTD